MNVQDLGAIGEFVSSVVIVITLLVLIYEVRNTKRTALVGNAQERRRARDAVWSMPVESAGLAEVLAKASTNAGNTALVEDGRDYGLEPHEIARLANYWTLTLVHWADWVGDDLSISISPLGWRTHFFSSYTSGIGCEWSNTSILSIR